MPIRPSHVYGLVRRRGSVIGWLHATPTPQAQLGPVSGMQTGVLGGSRVAEGPFGETYGTQWSIWGLTSQKISRVFLLETGLVEAGDFELVLPVPFVEDDTNGVSIPSLNDLNAYNNGSFYQIPRQGVPATDRFIFLGKKWTAKAKPYPVIDNNLTVAFRILVSEAEF